MNILICTVGGSHQPIVRAIETNKPDFVCFICTGRDPATHRPGSEIQITGNGNFIKANHADETPSLPNIPTQCGLGEDQYELCLVPADDLDGIYVGCRMALQELRKRYPTARIITDYTGGTKSMSAGLVLAALEDGTTALQLVMGERWDLIGVQDGEMAALANVDSIRLERSMQPYLNAWHRFSYAEAAAGLSTVPMPNNVDQQGRFIRRRAISTAFAAWDAFDHTTARQILKTYGAALPGDWGVFHGVLGALTSKENPPKQQAAQLFDLYRNAERRFAQGRHDDGVARLYRLLEWTAQWLLEKHCQVRTADLPRDWFPEGKVPNRDGRYQAGLFEAWGLVGSRTTGPLANWYTANQNAMLDQLRARNGSILAHGFEPVSASLGQQFHDWLAKDFITALLEETAADNSIRINQLPPQLPTKCP